ncbi:MAG: DUF1707 SHOCT-like domain-containing protein [Streptosporangiales bacterium]
MSVQPPDRLSMRASDGDRERTAETLRDAAGDGRISMDELDERLTTTFAARTYADLAQLTADLPVGTPAASAVPAVPADDKPLLLVGKGGSVQRKGRWQVPRRIVIDRKFGSVSLNLREGQLAAQVTEVDVRMKFGSLVLILPDGATAAVDCSTEYGTVRSTVPGVPSAGHPHVVITGEKEYGSLRVRYGYGHWWRKRRRGSTPAHP